jgi:apolipoprotein N-acyltransferase
VQIESATTHNTVSSGIVTAAHPCTNNRAPGADAPDRPGRLGFLDCGSWLWLLMAAVLLLFSNGANTIALAAWLAPVFVLRFIRGRRAWIGLPVGYALFMAAFAFQFRGMVPISGIAYCIFLIIWGIPLIFPYVIDGLVSPRLDGLMATLVFPTAWAATECFLSREVYGSWGSIAYSQYGNLPLLQILSVTGMWGVTFLMGWFAAVCNSLWQAWPLSHESAQWRRARFTAWLCASVIVAVMLLGGARLALFPPSSQTVRVASISKQPEVAVPNDDVFTRLFRNRATSEDIAAVRNWAAVRDNDLLTRAEREMQAGAKIVFWGETNAAVLKEDEPALLARGAKLAAKYQSYLGMAVGVVDRGAREIDNRQTLPLENKLILVQPDGRVAWMYDKAHPVPGGEAALQMPGDGRLRALDTPYGRLSGIICFDGDFPRLLAQAGALGADVMLDPSNDWRAIDPWHTQMASFRAIEQGFNLIRHTSKGLSAAYDYQGHRLAASDYYQTSDYAMTSDIPTRGVRTIYSRLGDWFGWLCLAALVFLITRSLFTPAAVGSE